VGSSIQPLRREVELIIARFLTPGSTSELNISPAIRKRALDNARSSTHPDIFKEAAEAAYHLMEASSLPNFVRFATSNINKPKKHFWLYVGTTDFMIGVLIYFLCIFLRVYFCFAGLTLGWSWIPCIWRAVHMVRLHAILFRNTRFMFPSLRS
jgi:Regulator of G protein signaling domain